MTLEVRQSPNLWIREINYKYQAKKKEKRKENNEIWSSKLPLDFSGDTDDAITVPQLDTAFTTLNLNKVEVVLASGLAGGLSCQALLWTTDLGKDARRTAGGPSAHLERTLEAGQTLGTPGALAKREPGLMMLGLSQ